MSGRVLGIVRHDPHECDVALNRETGLYDGNWSPFGEIRECEDCGAIWIKDKLSPYALSPSRDDPRDWYWREVTTRSEIKRLRASADEEAR